MLDENSAVCGVRVWLYFPVRVIRGPHAQNDLSFGSARDVAVCDRTLGFDLRMRSRVCFLRLHQPTRTRRGELQRKYIEIGRSGLFGLSWQMKNQ